MTRVVLKGLDAVALVLILGVWQANAAVPADLVTSLPGWEGPLTSKMYSGIMSAGDSCTDEGCFKMQEHYVYIESERSPATDPVVLWTNGGPGAASLFGLFVELGPYQVSDESFGTASFNETGIPTLFRNPYTWTKFANLLIINSPPPVGFSFCYPPGPAGSGTSCGAWNDTRTSYHNLEFLKSFFKAYPETVKRDFYLTGESYAGIYVPTLAREVLEYNAKAPVKARINLKGFAVGDACVGSEVNCGAEGPLSMMEFMRGHGQYSGKTDAMIRAACSQDELLQPDGHSKECSAALDRMADEVGGYFEYSLYDECWGENDLFAGPREVSTGRGQGWKHVRGQVAARRRAGQLGSWTEGYPCGGDGALTQWSSLGVVRDALHVSRDSNFFSGDNGQGFVYNPTEKSLLPFYKDVIGGKGKGALRIMVYVGDSDPCVNIFDAERWTTSLGFSETEPWRPWTMDGGEEMGGYVTRYAGGFDFLTIRGAGHMVPEYKPRASFTAIGSWLADIPWPKFKPVKPGNYVQNGKMSAKNAHPHDGSAEASIGGRRKAKSNRARVKKLGHKQKKWVSEVA